MCFLERTVALLRSPARGRLGVPSVVAVDTAPVSPPCAGVCLVNTQELDRAAVPLCFCENLQGGCQCVRPCLRLPGPAALGAAGTVPTGASHGPQRQAHPPEAGSESVQCALRARWLKMSVPLLGFSSTIFLFNLV